MYKFPLFGNGSFFAFFIISQVIFDMTRRSIHQTNPQNNSMAPLNFIFALKLTVLFEPGTEECGPFLKWMWTWNDSFDAPIWRSLIYIATVKKIYPLVTWALCEWGHLANEADGLP